MLETRDLYRDYITAIESKKIAVANKLTQYQGSQEYLKKHIKHRNYANNGLI